MWIYGRHRRQTYLVVNWSVFSPTIYKSYVFYADDCSSYEIARFYVGDVGGRASPSDDNQLSFPVDTSEQPRPSTSRADANDASGTAGFGRPRGNTGGPEPGASRRRSSSPAAWPPRPAAMSLDSDDDDDDDDVERLATYSSQGAAEPVDCRRDVGASSPTDDCRRGKQPATQSRVGANVAAKNRRRRTGVVTSSVTSESADDVDIALSQ